MTKKLQLEPEPTPADIERSKHWQPIVEAAGLWSRTQGPWALWAIAGAIMHDPIVNERAAQHVDETFVYSDENPYPRDVYETILTAMTPQEKVALKARLLSAAKR